MSKQFMPFSPIEINFSSVQELGELLSTPRNMLLIAGENTISRLKRLGINYQHSNDRGNYHISKIAPNPDINSIIERLYELRGRKFDYIVAIGGGSTLDLAKAISALYGFSTNEKAGYSDIVNAIKAKNFFAGNDPIDIIAVPTTAGTGSEVTKWATVWDFENGKKLSVDDVMCFPKAAYIIPELTVSMPAKLTLATGLDALSHAMEAFWAKRRNQLSQELAIAAIDLVRSSLSSALHTPDDIIAREKMCRGSLISGLAFSMTRSTSCHSISYPITMHFGVNHGFAVALTLPQMLSINSRAVKEIKRLNDIFMPDGGFEAWLESVTVGVQELSLSSFGIGMADIERIVNGAFTENRMDNNPVDLNKEDVEEILMSVV